MKVTIKGLQEAQKANAKLMATIKPNSGLGRAVLYLTTQAHRYQMSVTHVKTGALRASQRMKRLGDARYSIYIDESATNPVSRTRTSSYGPIENARGGEHAFAERTYRRGPDMAIDAVRQFARELP